MGHEITLFLGLVFSLLFIAWTGITPGGIIVPAYLALYLAQPARIAGTLAVSLVTLVCYWAASRFFILFGRRRFAFMVLTGGVWTLLVVSLFPHLFSFSPEYRIIGWVIPGLIANQFERQGILVTAASLITVTAMAWFAGQVIYRLF